MAEPNENTMRTQRLEFVKGTSAKFWQVQVKGKKTIVTYGRIGTDGRIVEREFDSARLAKAEAIKLIAQKKLKGYKPVSQGVSSANEIKAGKTIDIVGMVGHMGADRCYLGRIGGVTFTFLHWKFNDGETIEGSLTVILNQNLIGKKYDNAIKRYQPYSIFRMKLKIQKHPETKSLIGVIQKDYGQTEERELQRLAKKYSKPICVKDSDIGKLKLDRASRQFENQKVQWGKRKVSVDIAANELAEYCPKAE